MKKCLVMVLWVGAVSSATGQYNIVAAQKDRVQSTVQQQITPQTYTDQDMEKMGLNEADRALYRSERQTIKGQWWGHVSPVEFLMYCADDKHERDRYAKLYLSSNLPKAVAEKDAMVSMYEMAREVFADQHGLDE